MRRLRTSLTGTAFLLACGLFPGTARADPGWPTFDSSMGVECLTSTGSDICTSLRFALDVVGVNRLHYLALTNYSPDVFTFGGISSVEDADRNPLDWSSGGPWSDTELSYQLVDEAGAAASEPLYTVVSLRSGSTGTATDLDNIRISYYAKGYQGMTGTDQFETSGTTTTPEPASVALLGSGLLGVLGIGCRRRKGQVPDLT